MTAPRLLMSHLHPSCYGKIQGPKILCHQFNTHQSLVQFTLCPCPASIVSVPDDTPDDPALPYQSHVWSLHLEFVHLLGPMAAARPVVWLLERKTENLFLFGLHCYLRL